MPTLHLCLAGAFAYLTPNQAEPDWSNVPAEGVTNPLNLFGINRPNITSYLKWRNTNTWRIALSELQNILNSQTDLPKFNFNAGYDNLLTLGQYTLNNSNSAPLLADISEGNLKSRDRQWQLTTNSRAEDTISVDSVQVNIIRAWNPADINSGSDGWAVASNQPSQITSLEDQYSSVKIMPNHLAGSEIAIDKFGGKETSPHKSVLQVTSRHSGHFAELPYTVGEIAVDELGANNPFFTKNVSENGSSEIDTFNINSTFFKLSQNDVRQDTTLKVSIPSIVPSQELFNSNLSHANTSLLTSIDSTAQSIWHTNTSIDLTFDITNLPTGQLAEATITRYDTNGRPNAATISIDTDANGVGWFIDPTPQDNTEYTGIENYFTADPNSPESRVGNAHQLGCIITTQKHHLHRWCFLVKFSH